MNLFKYFYSFFAAGKHPQNLLVDALKCDEKQEVNGYGNDYRRYQSNPFIGTPYEDQSVDSA